MTPKSGEATRRSTLESCAGSPEANSGTERDMCSDAMKLKSCTVRLKARVLAPVQSVSYLKKSMF